MPGTVPATPRLHRLLVLATAALLCALRLLPYRVQEHRCPSGTEFLGIAYSTEDGLQYADFVAQAREGRFFFSDRFTLEAEDPRLVILPLYLVGRAADGLGLSVSAAWLGFHALAILAFFPLLFWFLKFFFADPRARLGAFFFLVFAGGLDGWVALFHNALPAAWEAQLQKDLWPVLGWTPFMTSYNPLYLAGWCGLLLWLRLALAAETRPGLWLPAGLLLTPLYLWHAYDAVVAAGAAFGAALAPLLVRLEARETGRCLLHRLAMLPGLALTAALHAWQLGDPLFARLVEQSNSHLFVSPLLWLLGFGAVLPLAVHGARRLAVDDGVARLLFGWLGAASALSFLPVYEGRHFLYFVSLPLYLLAYPALGALRARLWPNASRFLLGAAAVLILGNSFARNAIYDLRRDNERACVRPEELAAAAALEQLPEGGVLCSRETGNWLPHRSGRRAAMGHWFMTESLFGKREAFARLLSSGTPPAERDAILRAFGARYLFYGPRERALGPPPRTEAVVLEPVFARGAVTIYRVGL